MNAPTLVPSYSIREEVANSVTHGVGIVLAIAGLAVLVAFATLHGDIWHIVACSVFGATLILLYTSSTLYHSLPIPRLKPLLRALDHSAIFLLIAGTYTPFTLVNLRGPWGWSLFATIWTLGISGIILRLFLKGRLHGLVVALYVAMGWVALVAAVPLVQRMAPEGLAWLVGGGVAYTLGAVVFHFDNRVRYAHFVWHLFVLAGSACHVMAALRQGPGLA